jgi:uncharacterized protein
MPAKIKDSGNCHCGSAFTRVLTVIGALAIAFVILMGLAFAVSVIAGGSAARGTYAGVFPSQYGNLRTITLTASGSASAAPDMAEIMVSMNGTGQTAALANANLSASVAAMNMTVLPFLNGNTSMIQTTSYQISQATNCTYPPVVSSTSMMPYYCITTKLPYYVASESFVISVPSIKNSSQAITGLSTIPGIQLQGVQAALSTGLQGTLNNRALSAALANATSQAQLLAGAGVHIYVENITVQSGFVYYPVAYATLANAGKSAASVNSSAFYGGKATTQKSIGVVFSIQ